MSISSFKRISVIGLGYIGLPTAAIFASRNIEVIGVDVNPDVVKVINQGKIHIIEPDLDRLVAEVVREGYLRATTIPEPADAFLIAVPTPIKDENYQPDIGYIEAAARLISVVLKKGDMVILESTSPVGATELMAGWFADFRPDLTFPQQAGEESDIRIAHCPERVLPGNVLQELLINDRVIGGMTQACAACAVELYKTIVIGECVIASGPRVAEMAKLSENSFRDVNIAFANELSLVCDKIEIDVWELIEIANRHPRVNILNPGPGVGGHCIAVDPWFIVSSAPDQARLIKEARSININKPEWVIDKVRSAILRSIQKASNRTSSDVTVAIYGLTFKPNIDDLRESPALQIAREITIQHDGPLKIIEPNIEILPPGLTGAKLEVLEKMQADVHVMLVKHRQFDNLPTPSGVVVDAVGVWKIK